MSELGLDVTATDVYLTIADGKLVQMTTDFEALHERTLKTTEFGEGKLVSQRSSTRLDTFADAQVNINWGSKATQFHGSLGKAAAASTSNPQAVGSSPDDDGRVRISWRGDAAFFAVSTLDRYDDGECHV